MDSSLSINRIKELRQKLGLSQRDLASLLSRHCEGRIWLWESGKAMPSINNIIRIAEALNVNPEVLYPDLFAALKKKYEDKFNKGETNVSEKKC
jgi:transcriptional regulator with XRE-family HTH domain